MKLNKYFMLGLVSLTFAACSNEEEKNVTTDNTEGKVYVSLSLGSAKSRSLGESAEGKTNNIKNLKVFFYTSSNQYVNYVVDQAVLNKAVTDLATAQSATIELTEVPGSADRIYIIANEKEKNPIAIGSWAAVENTDIYLVNQVKESFTTFSNEESTMTGYSKITSNTEVTLKPVTCRLEVQNFIAQKAPASFLGKDIEKFDVKGIYINSFYAQGKLGNIADNNREQVDMKEKGFNATAYADYKYLFDEPTYAPTENPTATSTTYTTGNGIWKVSPVQSTNENQPKKWWGYSVLKGYVPHLIIKLDVTYDGDSAPVERYLTIHQYKIAAGSTPLDTFERGNAYRIENLMFDATNLTEEPYEETKTVSATVSVSPWTGVDILPDFGN